MDYKIVIGWIVSIVIRGMAWMLTAKLGFDAASSQDLAGQIGNAAGAIIVAGVSIYTSYKSRQKLLMQPPPAVQTK